uniref:Uncharacterized protein n=1 Tax=Eutreptiella gymnastica TaxID=73025 RepID=A0A7S4LFJ5_9EUGL
MGIGDPTWAASGRCLMGSKHDRTSGKMVSFAWKAPAGVCCSYWYQGTVWRVIWNAVPSSMPLHLCGQSGQPPAETVSEHQHCPCAHCHTAGAALPGTFRRLR